MMQKWYIRARKFILEQRQAELKKAIGRYPNSDRYAVRVKELEEVEKDLSELEPESL